MRFQLTQSVVGKDGSGQHRQLRAGTTIADTVNNAVGNDVVMPSITANPDPKKLIALDAAASTAVGLPIGTNAHGAISGADSIQP